MLRRFSPLNLVFAYLAYKNFGWVVYKKIGASVEMTMMYTRYQQMIALLKLDVQIGINVVLIAGFFLYTTNIQLYLDIGVLCSTVFLAAIGWVYYSFLLSKTTVFSCFLISFSLLGRYPT